MRTVKRIAIEMQPGDTLIFSVELYHDTAPNASSLRPGAVHFSYHQINVAWGELERFPINCTHIHRMQSSFGTLVERDA